ncbi:MAG: fibronectin type III domain-containing protein, partial [Gammaproteobacteria bacterium]|nr:fibronectin type III domain-containing protein [Gammaproteobacteria bacterium]
MPTGSSRSYRQSIVLLALLLWPLCSQAAPQLQAQDGSANRPLTNNGDVALSPPRSGHNNVTRGPYLQQGTPTSVVVQWRTATASDSRVRYGDAPGHLTHVADETVITTEHAVTLTGLSP